MLEPSSREYNVTSFGAGLIEYPPPSGPLGEVIATFEHSCYVAGPNCRLICIAGDQAGDGPAMLKVAFCHRFDMGAFGVRVGMPVFIQGGDLFLGAHIRLRLAGAIPWTPPAVSRSAPPGTIMRCLRTLVEDLTLVLPDTGLAPLVPHVEDLANGRQVRVGTQSQIVSLALPGVSDIVNGLSSRSKREIDNGVRALVGFGPGLTPSGDDFLGGTIIALRSLCAGTGGYSPSCYAESGMDIMTSVLADCIVRRAAAGTTRISAALLTYATEGVASAAVHRLVRVILEADTRSQCSRAALQVACVGHTSGWDCLAGLFVGIHIALASCYSEGLGDSRPSSAPVRHGVRR